MSVSAHAALRANHRRQVRLLSSRKAGNVRNLSHVISLVDNNYYKQILEGLITCYGVSRMMTASPDQYSPAKALACDSSWPLGGPPPLRQCGATQLAHQMRGPGERLSAGFMQNQGTQQTEQEYNHCYMYCVDVRET